MGNAKGDTTAKYPFVKIASLMHDMRLPLACKSVVLWHRYHHSEITRFACTYATWSGQTNITDRIESVREPQPRWCAVTIPAVPARKHHVTISGHIFISGCPKWPGRARFPTLTYQGTLLPTAGSRVETRRTYYVIWCLECTSALQRWQYTGVRYFASSMPRLGDSHCAMCVNFWHSSSPTWRSTLHDTTVPSRFTCYNCQPITIYMCDVRLTVVVIDYANYPI